MIIKLLGCYRMKIMNGGFSKGKRMCVCVMKRMKLTIDIQKFRQATFHVLYTHTIHSLHFDLIIKSCSLKNSKIMFKICFLPGTSTWLRVLAAGGLQCSGVSQCCSCREAPLLPKPWGEGGKLFVKPQLSHHLTNVVLPSSSSFSFSFLNNN